MGTPLAEMIYHHKSIDKKKSTAQRDQVLYMNK